MAKQVVVIASGETERRALPHLISNLRGSGIEVQIRIPPSNLPLTVEMADRLIRAAWYGSADSSPDKFVVLLDLDGAEPDPVMMPFQEELQPRLQDPFRTRVLCAYAQWHLEAWYFGDASNLRDYLGRAEGRIDTSRPDQIENPKNHLQNLLGNRVYTARVSEEIAMRLDPRTIAGRSPSFANFLQCVMNGATPQTQT